MFGTSVLGIFSLLITIVIPVLLIFISIWIYQIKKNSETQIEQNKEIIQSLKKIETDCKILDKKRSEKF